MKLLIMQSSPASCHFLPIMSKYSPHHPILSLNLLSSLSVRDQVSHPYKRAVIFKFLDRRREDKL
jgi:hypothetical protein